MLSIAIAAQVVVRQGSLNEGTTTLQGLFNNYSLIGSISISGLLPITFTLLTLQTAGVRSWYLIILSVCTVAVSAATLLGIGSFEVSPADLQKLASPPPSKFPECGIVDPTTFCLELPNHSTVLSSINLEQGGVGGSSLLLSLTVLALLILDRLRSQLFHGYKCLARVYLRVVENLIEKVNEQSDHKKRAWTFETLQRFLRLLTECLFATVWITYIVIFIYYLKSLTNPGNGATIVPVKVWTFGQIVAITVWAVPLFEFVKLSIGRC